MPYNVMGASTVDYDGTFLAFVGMSGHPDGGYVLYDGVLR